ncbi:MAG TPA: hypothetical protein PK364_05535 [Synergistaceae bacterium]|nr:hypothetical protein [Synergistaceae bacterium]HPQ37312.1 hypothetical protein [Synergistaceae bacterium]
MNRVFLRLLVTGTRGKSGLVAYLCSLLHARGYAVWGRSTGTRALSFEEGRWKEIRRTSPASVEEMRWWLRQIPPHVNAVVLENSAVHPELQLLAAQWLEPTATVWTNALEDHQELWGPGDERAREVLLRGIPSNTPVFLGSSLLECPKILRELELRNCPHYGPEKALSPEDFREERRQLARQLWKVLELEEPFPDFPEYPREETLLILPLGMLARAFEANDPCSTRRSLEKLGWDPRECTLWFHNRPDRPGRFEAFRNLAELPWKNRFLTGAHPFRRIPEWNFLGNPQIEEMLSLLEGNIFGCGNVKGLPLRLMDFLERRAS